MISVVPGMIQSHSGIDRELVDRLVDVFDVPFFQAGEQYGGVEGAAEAVGLSRLGGVRNDVLYGRIPGLSRKLIGPVARRGYLKKFKVPVQGARAG